MSRAVEHKAISKMTINSQFAIEVALSKDYWLHLDLVNNLLKRKLHRIALILVMWEDGTVALYSNALLDMAKTEHTHPLSAVQSTHFWTEERL